MVKKPPDSPLNETLISLLVVEIQCGNRHAVKPLVEKFSPRLFRHSMNLVGHIQTVQDIVQESWVSIFKGLHRLRNPNVFPSWALKIAHRRSLDFLRKSNSQKEVPFETLPEITAEASQEPSHHEIGIDQLSDAIATLGVEEKTLLKLYYLEGFKVREISEITSIPKGTIKYMLFQTRKKLKQMVSKES